jgi:hypothetical protein
MADPATSRSAPALHAPAAVAAEIPPSTSIVVAKPDLRQVLRFERMGRLRAHAGPPLRRRVDFQPTAPERYLRRYGGNVRTWRAVNRAVVGASLSPIIPIGPGTQRVRFSIWTERCPSFPSEIRRIVPSSVRYTPVSVTGSTLRLLVRRIQVCDAGGCRACRSPARGEPEPAGQVVSLAGDIVRSRALDFLVDHAGIASEGESFRADEDSTRQSPNLPSRTERRSEHEGDHQLPGPRRRGADRPW